MLQAAAPVRQPHLLVTLWLLLGLVGAFFLVEAQADARTRPSYGQTREAEATDSELLDDLWPDSKPAFPRQESATRREFPGERRTLKSWNPLTSKAVRIVPFAPSQRDAEGPASEDMRPRAGISVLPQPVDVLQEADPEEPPWDVTLTAITSVIMLSIMVGHFKRRKRRSTSRSRSNVSGGHASAQPHFAPGAGRSPWSPVHQPYHTAPDMPPVTSLVLPIWTDAQFWQSPPRAHRQRAAATSQARQVALAASLALPVWADPVLWSQRRGLLQAQMPMPVWADPELWQTRATSRRQHATAEPEERQPTAVASPPLPVWAAPALWSQSHNS